MFSSLVGMPVFEYVRLRRMTVAAVDVIGGEDLLMIAVRCGYASTEAFGRASEQCAAQVTAMFAVTAVPFRTSQISGSA